MLKNPKDSKNLVVWDCLGHKSVFVIWILVIWYCFEFRALALEFPCGDRALTIALIPLWAFLLLPGVSVVIDWTWKNPLSTYRL
jgi:hypothetical protein